MPSNAQVYHVKTLVLVTISVLVKVSISAIKTRTKSLQTSGHTPSLKDVRKRTQRMNIDAGSEAEVIEENYQVCSSWLA